MNPYASTLQVQYELSLERYILILQSVGSVLVTLLAFVLQQILATCGLWRDLLPQ